MFSQGAESPSRYELLSMVKKHSKLLGKTIVDEQDASDVELDQAFWHDVLNLYFVQGKESRGRQDDDLIFFVRKLNLHGHSLADDLNANSPYFVRRWASKEKHEKQFIICYYTFEPEPLFKPLGWQLLRPLWLLRNGRLIFDVLDNMVGDNLMEVDWRRSFYLNLIAHTSFTVIVAICRSFNIIKWGKIQNCVLYKVVKTVYASPSQVNFHLDSRKEVETVPAYPDICFAIDDFDSTFDTVVLSDADHCYCVVLNAHAGAAFPSEKSEHEVSVELRETEQNLGKTNQTKVTIFSGFVSYQMVHEAYDAGRNRFGSLLSFSHSSGKVDRIYMKGPGGRGEVEVAVSGVEDQSQHSSGPSSPVNSKSRFGLATIVRRAASVASVAAKQAYAAASNNADDENAAS